MIEIYIPDESPLKKGFDSREVYLQGTTIDNMPWQVMFEFIGNSGSLPEPAEQFRQERCARCPLNRTSDGYSFSELPVASCVFRETQVPDQHGNRDVLAWIVSAAYTKKWYSDTRPVNADQLIEFANDAVSLINDSTCFAAELDD